MENIEMVYLFGRRVEATRNELMSVLSENAKELKEIIAEFHNFFAKLAEKKGETENGRISHRFATLMYSAVKLYFFTNWRIADVDWADILALELALTEVTMRIADEAKEDMKKEEKNDINVR